MTCELREELASYALGILEAADRAAVDAHLATCADCRAELAEFDGVAALLDRTTASDIVSAVGPLPDLVPGAIAVRRARRRRRLLVSAAAACVVLGGGTAAVVAATRTTPAPAQARTVVEAVDATSHVSAKVSYLASDGGTKVWLTLAGVPAGEDCELIAIGEGNKREVASTWHASYAGEATAQGMTALPVTSLKGFEIATTGGRHLVWVDAARS